MKKASRLLAAGAVAGGVMAKTLSVGKRKLPPRAKRGAFAATGKVPRCAQNDSGRGTLSPAYIDHHAAPYFSFEDFWGQRHQIRKSRFAHRAVELVERQVGAEPPPGLLARRLGQHHRIDAVDADATQDEGQDRTGERRAAG